MMEGLKSLTTIDILYAALMAFVATQLVLSFSRYLKLKTTYKSSDEQIKDTDKIMIIKKCIAMFPVETIYFRGKVFTKGMRVRITTFQQRVIEGEIIGKNEMDILCVMAGQHIIAHEIAKIEDIIEMPSSFQ